MFTDDTFQGLHINERICTCLNEHMKIERPTEVQKRAIPAVLSGRDVLLRSMTGMSGKDKEKKMIYVRIKGSNFACVISIL